jgi:phosphodiesterase/alkaline phosphatase D-like protein
MKAKLFLAAAIMFGMGISSASAQVKQRAQNQHQRIKQGVQSGELTKRETVNLARQQREIRKDVKEAKRNDGVITQCERKEIRQDQRQASRNIYRKKHNGRDRN